MKLKMTSESEQFLREYLPDIFSAASLRDALDLLYDLIDEKGFTPPEYCDYNDFGRVAQSVYDDLYLSNNG